MRKENEGKLYRNVVRATLAGSMFLSGCGLAEKINAIDTPSAGEALPIGLLDETAIFNLPSGEVRDSFLNELNSTKQECAEIFGCVGGTIQIYRVITNDNVYSYRFANVDDAKGQHTMILSVMDGKNQETTHIKEDLVAMDTKIDNIPSRVFGYVDDQGNSHYLMINLQTKEGDKFIVFDSQGNPYDVVAQNEKEVQAYSHLWQEPDIVQAEALPTTGTTPEISITTGASTQTEEKPTETATPTSVEKGPASTEWQVSPDGHIVYNESQLYEGMFTINKEHPEYVEKYWEELVRGLWNLNFVSENINFINQFQTADSFINYLKNDGGLVNNLWIPVIYPSLERRFVYQATMIPASNQIDLSSIAITIYKPSEDEMYKYSPNYSTGTNYISYLGAAGEVVVEETKFNGNNILKMTYRRDLFMDAERKLATNLEGGTGQNYKILALGANKSSEENLLAATQLIRSWPLHMQIKDTGYGYAWKTDVTPPVLNFSVIWPTYQEYKSITTLEGSPLVIR